MSRKDLKNREPVNCAVARELNRALIEISNKTKIPKSKLLDEAISDFLKKYSEKFE